MKYKFVKRKNPADKNAPPKFYATPVYDGKVTKKQISDDLVLISSLSRGDISSVIENLIDSIPKYLLMNQSVQLGELGTIRLAFSSEGVDDINDFHIGMIRGKKVIFTPGPLLKKIFDGASYERVKEKNN